MQAFSLSRILVRDQRPAKLRPSPPPLFPRRLASSAPAAAVSVERLLLRASVKSAATLIHQLRTHHEHLSLDFELVLLSGEFSASIRLSLLPSPALIALPSVRSGTDSETDAPWHWPRYGNAGLLSNVLE